MIKRFGLTFLALALSTSAVFAAGIPVGCSDGSRNEPQAPTVIPAWNEDVADILHEAEFETHTTILGGPQYPVIIVPQSKYCGPEYAGTGYQRENGFCDIVARGPETTSRRSKSEEILVAEEWVEVTPDIEHPEEVIPNPDLVVPTLTVTWLDFYNWQPVITYTTHDGSCPSH